MTSFTLETRFTVPARTIYSAWLNSKEHAAMTGGDAECSNQVGGTFEAWDGYISGKNKSLQPSTRIEQSWRTVEFDSGDEDSLLVIELEEEDGICKLTLHHSNIPDGQPDYEQGWIDNYFDPMHQYFDA